MYAMVLEFEVVAPGQQARLITYIFNTSMPNDVAKAGCVRVVALWQLLEHRAQLRCIAIVGVRRVGCAS